MIPKLKEGEELVTLAHFPMLAETLEMIGKFSDTLNDKTKIILEIELNSVKVHIFNDEHTHKIIRERNR